MFIPKCKQFGVLLDCNASKLYEDDSYFVYDNKLFTRVTGIEYIRYTGNIYDFNMENNHNYVMHGGLVHNSGKRNGSSAVYLEPHHPDTMAFLDLKKNHGNEDERTRDLFLALWISDLFMEKVEADGDWYFLDPDVCPGLTDCYGDEYKELYQKYVDEEKYSSVIKARKVWKKITTSQAETGVPYIGFKDHVNKKNNQKHYGVIRSSNLCIEINLYSDKDEYADCVLASLGLPAFVYKDADNNVKFDFDKLIEVTGVIVKNLNKVIDINYYPVPETKVSNMKHRPLGVGVQGLADVFSMFKFPFASDEAKELNKQIFESIYYGAVKQSCELAKVEGPYETFKGSPMSEGIFQFDMWNVQPSDRYDWAKLRSEVMEYGIRNSTLLALMPTASTSQILGNNECFEAYTSNIYSRNTLAGQFAIINKHLVRDLMELKLWDKNMKDLIIANDGSIQGIDSIPSDVQELYKTIWEIKQKDIIDMAADRGAFVCQTQSMNLFFAKPSNSILYNALMYAWKKGLKTGCYYIRAKPEARSQQFTIDKSISDKAKTLKSNEDSKQEQKQEEDKYVVCDSCSG
jgi:ribonucleoside-diphosphate reductase alpha chain